MEHFRFTFRFLIALSAIAFPFRCLAAGAVGHVVDPSGKPVVGATVTLINFRYGGNKTLLTDQSGSFSVDEGNRMLPERCVISAPGFAPAGGYFIYESWFHLSPPTQLSGKVVDAKGQPLAGAIVGAHYALNGASNGRVILKSDGFLDLSSGDLASRYTVKTDSNGAYTITGLPTECKICVGLDDPRYVKSEVVADVDAAAAPLLTALPGALVSGRVLGPDGKAARDINIEMESSHYAGPMAASITGRTAVDGTYSVTGLVPGLYKVVAREDLNNNTAPDWIAPAPVSVQVSTAAVAAVPDIVLKSGGIISGSVLDADTNKPVPNAYIQLTGALTGSRINVAHAVTDSNGVFTVHAWNGPINIRAVDAPDDYVIDGFDAGQTVTGAEGQTVMLDPILLTHMPPIAGSVVDISGNPISDFCFTTHLDLAHGGVGFEGASLTDGKGQFTIHALKPGTYSLNPGYLWKVVSPTSFSAPLTAPLKVVLDKYPTISFQGTVVDTGGTPIASVTIPFDLIDSDPVGFLSTQADFISGSDGRYCIPAAPLEVKLIVRGKPEKHGYVYKNGGDLTSTDGVVSISPIIMAALDGSIVGVVKNGWGNPVAGAWVYSPNNGDDELLVQTDSSGEFKLKKMLVDNDTVFAAKGRFAAQCTVKALSSTAPAAKSIIQLSGAPSEALGASNLTRAAMLLNNDVNDVLLMNNHPDGGYIRDEAAHILADVSPQAAVNFILSSSSIDTDDLGQIISPRLTGDPLGIAKWALAPVERISGNIGRGRDAAELGLAAASSSSQLANQYYGIAAQYINIDFIDRDSITSAMDLTALAYALHRPDADHDYNKVMAALATILASLKKQHHSIGEDPQLLTTISVMAKSLALGNVDKTIVMLSKMDSVQVSHSLVGVINELRETNPDGALTVLHAFESRKDSAWDDVEGRAFCAALPLIYKADPKEALARTKALSNNEVSADGLTILADLMPLSDAIPLYEEALKKADLGFSGNFSPARVAYRCWLRDPALGAKLFIEARDKMMTVVDTSSVPDFAFYYSNIDPAYSRLLLEKKFAEDLRSLLPKIQGDTIDVDVAAMAAIDINRAIAMAAEIKDPNVRFAAGLKAAQYVLLTPQQRSALPFSQWRIGVEWTPGMLPTSLMYN
jgi:protocatechuate 3,4-dioxygenase beta subunit